MISHTSVFQGETIESQGALLQSRPCAADIVYGIAADKTFRLNAAASACDERYKKNQEKLYSKTMWKLAGNKFPTSATNFAVGQTYTISLEGNRMTWVGTDNQGALVYQKK